MTDLRKTIRKAKFRAGALLEFISDWRRYIGSAFVGSIDPDKSARHLEAQLTLGYHRVEKALTFSTPKRPFGASIAKDFEKYIPLAEASSVPSSYWLTSSLDAQKALHRWNSEGIITDEVAPVVEHYSGLSDPEDFFYSRHSIRSFSDRAVSDDLLNRAVHLAIKSPSVCNRQAWHVRFLRGDIAEKARHFQNGNRGIDRIPVLAVISVDARMFNGRGERNQGWIEGGIFSMSLVYALHALGVGSCMLNMSVTNKVSDGLRKLLDIPDSEFVIMMVAIGYPAAEARAPRSTRREVNDVRAD